MLGDLHSDSLPGPSRETQPPRKVADPDRDVPYLAKHQTRQGGLPSLQVIPTNTRAACAAAMEKAKEEIPWFGIEQEYTLLSATNKRPLGALYPNTGTLRHQRLDLCNPRVIRLVKAYLGFSQWFLMSDFFAGINSFNVFSRVPNLPHPQLLNLGCPHSLSQQSVSPEAANLHAFSNLHVAAGWI